MARTLTRLSSSMAIGTLLCLAQPVWPAGQGCALAATMTAKDTARAKQARQLYKEGRYEDAAKIFSDLSSEHPDLLVFTRNLGACYYYLRRPEPALSNLREYLHRGQDVTPDDRSEVERWIAEMEQMRTQPATPAAAGPAVVASPGQPPAPVPTTAEVPPATLPAANLPPVTPPTSAAEAVSSGPVDAPVSSGSRLRIAGIACGALGLVSIGTAIYYYTRASALSDRITSSKAPSASDFKSGKNAETMQWVFYGVGAGALATGSVLYYLGWRASLPGATAVAPMVGPGFAGLSAQGAF